MTLVRLLQHTTVITHQETDYLLILPFPSYLSGAGGNVSTAADYLRFVKMLANVLHLVSG